MRPLSMLLGGLLALQGCHSQPSLTKNYSHIPTYERPVDRSVQCLSDKSLERVLYIGQVIRKSIYYGNREKFAMTVMLKVPLLEDSYYEDEFGSCITTQRIQGRISEGVFGLAAFFDFADLIDLEKKVSLSITGVLEPEQHGQFPLVQIDSYTASVSDAPVSEESDEEKKVIYWKFPRFH